MSNVEDDDAQRRRNEINMFAAFALGGVDDPVDTSAKTGGSDNPFDSGSVRIPAKKSEEARKQDEISAFAAAAGGDPASLFSASANSGSFVGTPSSRTTSATSSVTDSGTFAMLASASANSSSLAVSSKQESSAPSFLEQAAAALAVGDDDDDDVDGDADGLKEGGVGGLASNLPSALMPTGGPPNHPKMKQDYPMYAEEVRMPRPLFFGPILPPRVLKEAREIVQQAVQEQQQKHQHSGHADGMEEISENGNKKQPTVRLSSLPPEVQNIVGAMRQYGHGLSAFPFDDKSTKDEEAENSKPFWKGTSYVSTFQPVFGETARRYRNKHGILPANGQQAPEQQQQQQQQNLSPLGGAFPSPLAVFGGSSSRNLCADVAAGGEADKKQTSQEQANAAFLANISGEAAAPNPQDNATPGASKANDPSKNEINLFSMWARGEGTVEEADNNSHGNCSNDSFGSFTMEPKGGVERNASDMSDLTMSIRTAATKDHMSSDASMPMPRPMSDQDLFSQWARGASPGQNNNSGTFTSTALQNGSVVMQSSKSSLRKPPPRFEFTADTAGTFQRIPTASNLEDSDDDSIVGSEMKKKVGVNEHLDKALASLVDDGPSGQNEGEEAENTRNMLQMMRTTPGGRPLSNLELTNGCVPVYGVDDSPLPVEGDLGIHETKVDEQRTFEQNRSQEIIEKYVGPNIFGPVACPNPATGPDDSHSWNSRAAPSQRYNVGGAAGVGVPGGGNHPDRVGVLPVPSEAHSPKPPAGPSRKATRNQSPRFSSRNRTNSNASAASTPLSRTKSKGGGAGPASGSKRGGRYAARHRYGWWSIPEDFDQGKGGVGSSDQSVFSASEQSTASIGNDEDPPDDPLQLPPLYHPSHNLHVDTRLQPGPEALREENLPLSELHSATSIAHGLPYLSDRPPSYRYLQIDTQAVGFPPLGGEVEPLFCSLAIYNVETTAGVANDPTSAPMPDLERCGRVTEVLNFDVVSDKQVEGRCIGSLWPFFSSSTMTPHQFSKSTLEAPSANAPISSNPTLQGTRCGVFPLPSNLNVANLYAVLIVQKVLSEDSDFEIYLKQSKSSRSAGALDINKFRSKAEKASNQHGSFLMPFAFGVAPLLQVFGADNPVVASSRAVQIPLFRFSAGKGERQIIDHIMVMLYPRADFRANGIGGPAAVTNGGTAMLVMRNFGYLGLHAVVHSRSSLARDRLVDFTGELQVRRRNTMLDPPVNNDSVVKRDDHVFVVPEWHPQFIAEPAVNGGRNAIDPFAEEPESHLESLNKDPSRSTLYAQELAPVPLSPVPFAQTGRHSPAGNASPRARAPVNRADIESYYHTSFCNELLCHPRLLHHCPKGNIVMKVELREMEYRQEFQGFVAHLPRHGPSVHNTRRGPFLIQGTYTSCAVRSSDPHFLDEVKVKLPLQLKPGRTESAPKTLALFFSAYHVKFSSKKKWSKVLPIKAKRDSSVSGVNDVDETTGERTEIAGETGMSGKCKLVLLACGFLPVTAQSSLIENGLHDVKMMYKARPPTPEMRTKGGVARSSLIVVERSEASVHSLKDSQASSGFDPFGDDITTGSGSRTHSEAELLGTGDESDSAFSEGSGRGELINADALSQAETSQKMRLSQEHMTLQVRIIVHSSLHAQNAILSDFLQNETDQPSEAVGSDKGAMQILGLSRDEMVHQFGAGMLSSSLGMPEEDRMLNSVVSVAKPQFCATSDVARHFLRVATKLWKTLICGTGETDLSWANPGAVLPLRVHAFGSLLQLLGNVAQFMAKSGVTQVDGTNRFDMVSLGRVVSLLFDEEGIFGCHLRENVGDVELLVKPAKSAKVTAETTDKPATEEEGKAPEKPKRRRRHQRNNFELHNDTHSRHHSIDFSDPSMASNLGDLGSGTSPPTATSTEKKAPAKAPDEKQSAPLAIDTSPVSDLDLTNLYPPSASRQDVKVDSVSDFRSNLKLGLEEEASCDSFDAPLTSSNVNSLTQKFGGMSAKGKSRFMTMPALATIREDEGDDSESPMISDAMPLSPVQTSSSTESPVDPMDAEMVFPAGKKKSSVKQMRVPKIKGKAENKSPKKETFDLSAIAESFSMPNEKQKFATMSAISTPRKDSSALTLAKSDDEIFSAGSAFLDSIGQNFGVSNGKDGKDLSTGAPAAGPHRRTRSRCSIDWNLLAEEPKHNFEIEQAPSKDEEEEVTEDQLGDDNDESMSTLHLEDENCIRLPNYVDRLVTLGKSEPRNGRWFPFGYEVVIMMWTAFLQQQRDKANGTIGSNGNLSNNAEANLAEAASSAHRGTIASAPLLFEIIKQSMGFRVKDLSQEVAKGETCRCPQVAELDDNMQSRLENLISMITDACLNSRNFDSREMRQMSIFVNDSIVRFLRDMFGFLKPSSAYRLVLVYMSRFVTKEGKQGQDRDSSIGLRCSWEVTKLRLNAMTALIRFPDFLRVCSPQSNVWGTPWMHRQGLDKFFEGVLDRYKQLGLSEFAAPDGPRTAELQIPPMRPHWLAEIVTTICLDDIWHAEEWIQKRAASLLHELFWASSQQSMGSGTAPITASMYITFVEKVLNLSSGLSNYAPKSQLRKDIVPCVLFVLQDAPSGLLRAQWRKLCLKAQGKGSLDRYGGIGYRMFPDGDIPQPEDHPKSSPLLKNEPDILDMFSLLNLALGTVEYEGCEDLLENDEGGTENEHQLFVWHKEYLLTQGQQNQQPFMSKRQNKVQGSSRLGSTTPNGKGEKPGKAYFSSGSRKWQAHDGSIVIVNCGHQIVTELSALLQSSTEGQAHLNQARRASVKPPPNKLSSSSFGGSAKDEFMFSRSDTVVFVRAATSLYLHALALRQSDLVLVRTFQIARDLVKIFGIKMFLEAVGETLQHWMRVVSTHCGARRAKVRIEATDFLALILRCTWESYGSFFRIRIPLLAVQTEVMERIVAIAAARYYREERRKKTTLDNFSNASAEASLSPLWRTLDRLHHQQASRNNAFKGALMRLAIKLKKLYRAYIAARALSYLSGMRSPKHTNGETGKSISSDADALVRAYRIAVLRVINASAGYSKQFLGFHGTSLSNSSVAHYEAVEDAFLDAADVFSPTELPEHRVAWLQMLADFHASRKKPGEEATCHFQIHVTLKHASSLHGSLWSNTPFLPWTNSPSDPVHINGEAPSGNTLDYASDLDFEDGQDGSYGRHIDDANSSRRIFYRVANSVRANTEEWETGLSRTLFNSVCFANEFCSVSSWITLREMEEKMVEEAECAGDLFLQAGIIESSRVAWNLAAQYYSEKFSYGKLANVYGCLARAFVSQVPPIDANQQQEVSISMGRFYRVWFHGGAPDELIGAEFVYRTASWVKLEQFGDQLREVIKCIIPDRTPIHLDLDGRAGESSQRNYGGFSRLGPAPLEPVRIKVTPLRPLFAKGSKIRGLPEWFHRYIDEQSARAPNRQSSKRHRGGPRAGFTEEMGRIAAPGHRGNNMSFGSSASVFASGGSSASGSMFGRRSSLSKVADGNRGTSANPASAETELVGVDKFAFLQPKHHQDRLRGNKDWWKPASGDFAQKSLRVTHLQVGQAFPACVSRQAVVHRVVFNLSPLEAGVDGVCQWCSVLFRTAVATHGMAVLGTNSEHGIGTDAAKVVTECIHASRVRELGTSLLQKNGNATESEVSDIFHGSDRLMEDEVKKYQNKLARSIIVFLELLHLLIARNRDLLLSVIQERRKEPVPTTLPPPPAAGVPRSQSTVAAPTSFASNPRNLMRLGSNEGSEGKTTTLHRAVSEDVSRMRFGEERSRSNVDDQSYAASLAGASATTKTDSNMFAFQSELQRAFTHLTKDLYPGIVGIMGQSETPPWLKRCCQENYFSLGTYRQTRLRISEELSFSSVNENFHHPVPGADKVPLQSGLPPGALTGGDYLAERNLAERNAAESPSASVASSSVFSRTSEGLRFSKQSDGKIEL